MTKPQFSETEQCPQCNSHAVALVLNDNPAVVWWCERGHISICGTDPQLVTFYPILEGRKMTTHETKNQLIFRLAEAYTRGQVTLEEALDEFTELYPARSDVIEFAKVVDTLQYAT